MKQLFFLIGFLLPAFLFSQTKNVTNDSVISVRDKGLVANFYLPETSGKHPAIIVIGGSEGGIWWSDAWGKPLASRGYAVLSLAYFGMEKLPTQLEEIPLEYFKKAIDWVSAHPSVDATRIAFAGNSRGGGTALLVAATYPEVKAVIAGVPGHVVWQSINNLGEQKIKSSLTFKGKPLPFAAYDTTQAFTTLLDLYIRSLQNKAAVEAAIIPVEKIKGPILLISGKDDKMWPSYLMAENVVDRLKNKNFPFPYEHLSYDNAGHNIVGPPRKPSSNSLPVADTSSSSRPFRVMGGTPEVNNLARNDGWAKIIKFLDKSLPGHDDEAFTFPAEWEKHEAIWMSWRMPPSSRSIAKSNTLIEIIKTLTPHVKVNLFIDNDSVVNSIHELFAIAGIDKNKVQMFVYPNPYKNVRDPGPVFLKSNKGNLMVADMKWNFYGRSSNQKREANSKRIDTIDHFVAGKFNLPLRTSTLVSEGGAREFNGKGTLMVIEYTEMHRNKGWSRDSIEKELLRMFGQKKIIWLKQGTAEDDPNQVFNLPSGKVTTIGCNHIDEFARFSSPNTILLAEVTKEESLRDTVHKISYERLEENYRILKKATDQDGKPFAVIRVPVPELIAEPGIIDSTVTNFIATSYLNFLVTNGVVLMASYWKPGRPEIMKQKDKQAKKILQKAFPGRKIIQINVENLNEGGGGIHCATQQQPARR